MQQKVTKPKHNLQMHKVQISSPKVNWDEKNYHIYLVLTFCLKRQEASNVCDRDQETFLYFFVVYPFTVSILLPDSHEN